MEVITVLPASAGVDDDGRPLPGGLAREVSVKSVQPIALQELAGVDMDGVVDAVRVWAVSGSGVKQGDDVVIRGLRWRVERTAWDWSQNRRPALARHQPSVVFDCVRGAG